MNSRCEETVDHLANSHCCCHQQDKSPGLYGHGIWQKYGLECNVQKKLCGN